MCNTIQKTDVRYIERTISSIRHKQEFINKNNTKIATSDTDDYTDGNFKETHEPCV